MVFQSTLPLGRSDRSLYLLMTFKRCFNPRSHEGSDRNSLNPDIDINRVSIHAPTRGATPIIDDSACEDVFQSTLPRGERLRAGLSVCSFSPCFNPRSHEGSDVRKQLQVRLYRAVSIHAPTRGATSNDFVSVFGNCVSIHAPTRGATV